MFQQLLQEDFRMLQVVSTGAYYPPVDTTWKILTTGARLGICQKIYRTEFSGERILHTENA